MVPMRWMVVGAVVWGLLAGSAAAAGVWDNGGGDYLWNTAANWDDDTVPTATVDVSLDVSGGSTSGNPVTINAAATCNSFKLSYTYAAYLDINADFTVATTLGIGGKVEAIATHNSGTVSVGTDFTLLNTKASPNCRYIMTGAGATLNVTNDLRLARNDTGCDARFIQQAGTVTVGADFGSTNLDYIGGYQGYTAYEMSGGSLTVTGAASFLYKSEGDYIFDQSGGTASFGSFGIATNTSGTGRGKMILSGAADTSVTGNMTVGATSGTGTGTLVLDGSKTSGADLAVGGDFNVSLQGTLEAVIDQAAINTATDMRKIVVTGNATFDTGSTLKVSFDGGATPTPGTWTLMTVGGTLTEDLTLVADPGWSFSASSPLTVTYIPEPATLALLGLGGLGLLLRRRR